MCAVVGVYPCSRTDTTGPKTVPKTATACLYLFTGFVCLSVCLFALLLACDAYTKPIQARSGLIDARYLCLKFRTARVESGAEITELGHSDCFSPAAVVTVILYSNPRVLSQAATPPHPPTPSPPHHRHHTTATTITPPAI